MTQPAADYTISLYGHVTDLTPSAAAMPLRQLLALTKCGTWKHQVEAVRALYGTEKDAYKAAKQNLPCFTACGTFAGRHLAENLTLHNGTVHGDVDGLDAEHGAEYAAQLRHDPHVVYVFTSPSGHGIKYGVAIDQVVTTNDAYHHAWQVVADAHQAMYGIVWDKSAKDVSRLCFISYDPDAYYNDHPQPLHIPPPEPPREEPKATHPPLSLSDQDILNKARKAKNAGKFHALWEGDVSGYDADQSRADDALCAMLAFWTRDTDQIDRLFRQSGLMRDKWEKYGYSTRTIAKAMEQRTEYYNPQHGKQAKRARRVPNMTQSQSTPVESGAPVNGMGPAGGPSPQTVALPYSDYTNALAFVREHGVNVRYCYPWNKWLAWTGTHMQDDTSGAVMRMAKETIKRMARRIEHMHDQGDIDVLMKHIKASLKTSALKAMVECAQSEPGIAVQPEELERNPWLLNCANETLNLQTGTLKKHDRADLITRCLTTPYDQHAPCSAWKAFLWKIMAGRQDMIDFLQRIIGTALTGDVSEHNLYILWGSGANGKSTLINTILELLGPYAMKANAELLMSTHSDRHPTERADLLGKRFVAAIETKESGRLNETFVKEATGGDPIRARRMREDFWQFFPTHKLFLATNHKPQITGSDHAIWRRVKLLSFNVQIPDDQQDKKLPEKLRAELPGILAWVVRGCLAWQKDGLQPPTDVLSDTKAYQHEMDDIAKFVSEMCTTTLPGLHVMSSVLYKAYLAWGGDVAMSQKSFSGRLAEHGYTIKREETGMFWQGIGLPGSSVSNDHRYGKD